MTATLLFLNMPKNIAPGLNLPGLRKVAVGQVQDRQRAGEAPKRCQDNCDVWKPAKGWKSW